MTSMPDSATSEPAPPRLRLTGEERRSRILAAARSEFARLGYHGASTSGIARLAGCSEPMLYKHFVGKQALFTTALPEALEGFRLQFDASIDPELDLIEQVGGFIVRLMRDPAYMELLQLRMLAITLANDPEVRAALLQVDESMRERVRLLVAHGVGIGALRPDVDPEYIAIGWHGLMLASCYREALEPGSFADMAPHALSFMRAAAAR
jgi:AcrR family transcriptional regulator